MDDPGNESNPARILSGWHPLAVVALAILGFAAWAIHVARTDDRAAFLPGRAPEMWIKPPLKTTVVAFPKGPQGVLYRHRFRIEASSTVPELRFTALRAARVVMDGQVIHEDRPTENWRRERRVVLSDSLAAGQHTLVIAVINEMGPPMLSAMLHPDGAASLDRWSYSADSGEHWGPVWPASRMPPPEIARAFPPVREPFVRTLVLFLPMFVVGAALTLFRKRLPDRIARTVEAILQPRRLQWVLGGLLLILGLNNMLRLKLTVGTDIPEHYRYIHHVAEHHALPALTDGLQSFQAPLFYILAAALYKALTIVAAPETADRILRLIPIACGIGMVFLTGHIARKAFPARPALQSVAMVLAASLPMLVYKTQTVTNEPLAALLGSGVIAMLASLVSEVRVRPMGFFAGLGFVWGLAVLAKVSALTLAPVVALVLIWLAVATPAGVRAVILRAGVLTAIFAATCGWYFIRNYLDFGRPFVGGWDPLIGFEWWQFPGYRTLGQFLSFGRAMRYPVYAATAGPWDGIYAMTWSDSELSGVPNLVNQPKWNFPFMLAAVWWAVIPTLALGAGMLRAMWPGRKLCAAPMDLDAGAARARVVCLFAMGAYFAAVLAHTVTLPFYNAAKPTYALAAAPAMAVLMAWGLEPVTKNAGTRAGLYGFVAAWATIVYAAYFALAS